MMSISMTMTQSGIFHISPEWNAFNSVFGTKEYGKNLEQSLIFFRKYDHFCHGWGV